MAAQTLVVPDVEVEEVGALHKAVAVEVVCILDTGDARPGLVKKTCEAI